VGNILTVASDAGDLLDHVLGALEGEGAEFSPGALEHRRRGIDEKRDAHGLGRPPSHSR